MADGLFAAVLAARGGVIVPAGGTADFLAPFPVGVLGQPELAELLDRLGIRTLGDFAALPEAHVLGRFGSDGVAGHRVARGRSGELGGLRRPVVGRRRVRRTAAAVTGGQSGFWGGVSDVDARAGRALAAVQDLLGPDGVVTAHLQGGRGPAQRARFVTWSGREARPDTSLGRARGPARSPHRRRRSCIPLPSGPSWSTPAGSPSRCRPGVSSPAPRTGCRWRGAPGRR